MKTIEFQGSITNLKHPVILGLKQISFHPYTLYDQLFIQEHLISLS